jgi:small-conductance mechanosensitive channel
MTVALQAGGAIVEFLTNLGLPEGYAVTIAAVVKFVVAFVVIYLVGRTVVLPSFRGLLESRELEPTVRKPLVKVGYFVVVFVAFAVAFSFAGFGNFLTALATVAAAATLAIGFAAQDVIANLVAGVFIFVDKPFRIGDWIEWDDGTYSGTVEDISLRVTRVRTFDNELLTVPNSNLTDDVIKNPVAYEKLRLQFLFGIGYDDDVERATEIIIEEADAHPKILDDPEPTVRLTELADSYVGLKSRFWIRNPSRSDFVKTRGEYVTAVKDRFDEAGIDIPFPQRALSGEVAMANVEMAEAADD